MNHDTTLLHFARLLLGAVVLYMIVSCIFEDANAGELYARGGAGWNVSGVERCVEHPMDRHRSGCSEPYGELALGVRHAIEITPSWSATPALEWRHTSSIADGWPNNLGDGDRGTEDIWVSIEFAWEFTR